MKKIASRIAFPKQGTAIVTAFLAAVVLLLAIGLLLTQYQKPISFQKPVLPSATPLPLDGLPTPELQTPFATVSPLPIPLSMEVEQFEKNTSPEHISINPFSQSRKVPVLAGSNLGIWVVHEINASKLVPLVRAIKPGLLRFPGGEIGDALLWTRNNSKQWYEVPGRPAYAKGWLTPKDVDAAVAFARAVNASLVMQVNARINNPEMAADMVRYANVEKRYGIKYWNIGNEPDIWNLIHPREKSESAEVFSPATYVKVITSYSKAMKAADSSIITIAPSCSYFPKCGPWLSALAADVAARESVDVFSLHSYSIPFVQHASLLNGYAYYGEEGADNYSSSSAVPRELEFGWNVLTLPLRNGLRKVREMGVVVSRAVNFSFFDYVILTNFVLRNSKTGKTVQLAGLPTSLNGNILFLPHFKDAAFSWSQGQLLSAGHGWNIVSVPLSENISQPLYEVGLKVIIAGPDENNSVFVRRIFLSGPTAEKTIWNSTIGQKPTAFLSRMAVSPPFKHQDTSLLDGWNSISFKVDNGGKQAFLQVVARFFSGEGVFSVRNLKLVGIDGLEKPFPLDGFRAFDAAYSVNVENDVLTARFTSNYSKKGEDIIATLFKQIDLSGYSEVRAEVRVTVPAGNSIDGFGSGETNISLVEVSGEKVLKIPISSNEVNLLSIVAVNASGYNRLNFEVSTPLVSKPVLRDERQVLFTYAFDKAKGTVRIFSNELADFSSFDTLEARIFIPNTPAARDRALVSTADPEGIFQFARQAASEKPITVDEYGAYLKNPDAHFNKMAGAIWTLVMIEKLAQQNASFAASFDLIDSNGLELLSLNGTPNKRYYAFLLNAMSESLRVPITHPVDPAVFVSARVSENRSVATFILVNEHRDQPKKFDVSLLNSTIRSAMAWLLDASHDAMPVDLVSFSGSRASVELPPYSASFLRLELVSS